MVLCLGWLRRVSKSPVHITDYNGHSFSEILPQSLCTRYGLAIGANMAWFVQLLIYAIVSSSSIRPRTRAENKTDGFFRVSCLGPLQSSWNLSSARTTVSCTGAQVR